MIGLGATLFKAATRGRGFSPASLFSNGEEGVWYDPSKLSSMKQFSDGTVDAVIGQPVGYIEDQSGNGNHAIQATLTKRPILREAGGLNYLDFDGVDDCLSITGLTSTSTPLTAWFGYSADNAEAANKKFLLDIQSTRAVLAASANTAGNIGYFDGAWSEFAADSNALKVLTYDLVEDNAKIRVDGTQEYSDTTYDQRTIGGQIALFAKYDLGDSHLEGKLYSFILRAAESTDKEITSTESYVAEKTGKNFLEYSQFVNYGQSNSIGATASPALSTSQPYNNVMFNGGLFAGDTPANLTSFIPLVENTVETQASETANSIVRRIEDEDSVAPGNQGTVYLGTAPGLGGQTIEQLSKGTVYYNRILAQTEAANTIALSAGKPHRFDFMSYTQGEADYREETATSEYKQLLKTLLSDLNTDIKSLTAQAADFPMVVYQIASHWSYQVAVPNIAIAQHEASIEDPLISMATPMYIFNYNDKVHTTNDSNKHLGAYYGKVIKRVTKDKVSWNPLQPKSVDWQGDTIDITFDVPRAPLVLDTTWVAAETNFGFDVWDSDYSNKLNIVSSVTLVDSDKVRIVLSSTPADGSHLTYAFGDSSYSNKVGRIQGPRGNLRDSEGDVDSYVDDDGVTRRLDNYCVIFQTTKGS